MKTALCISQFQLVLSQLLVLLCHKQVANLSKHYELLCTLPPERNIFSLEKSIHMYHKGYIAEVALSINLGSNSQGQFSFSSFVED